MIVTMLALMELCVRTRNKTEACLISTIDTRPNQRRKRLVTTGKLDEDGSSENTPIFSVLSQSNDCSNLISEINQPTADDNDANATNRSDNSETYHAQPGTSNGCSSELISPIESSGCDDVITNADQSCSPHSSHESYATATTHVTQSHHSRQGNSRHMI